MKYIILLSFLFFIPISKAEIHIEPYVNGGAAYSSSISSSDKSGTLLMTFGLGSRFGYSFSPMSVGLDLFWTHYNTGSSGTHHVDIRNPQPDKGNHQPDKGFVGPSSSIVFSVLPGNFQPFSIGLFTALDLPFLFNAYGTVFYSIPAERRNANYQGYGVRGGLSYLSASYVQFNLELQWGYYMCAGSDSCSNDFNIISALLSISVPFSTDIFDFGNVSDSEENSDTEDSNSGDI